VAQKLQKICLLLLLTENVKTTKNGQRQ